jgi:hypothetical protein
MVCYIEEFGTCQCWKGLQRWETHYSQELLNELGSLWMPADDMILSNIDVDWPVSICDFCVRTWGRLYREENSFSFCWEEWYQNKSPVATNYWIYLLQILLPFEKNYSRYPVRSTNISAILSVPTLLVPLILHSRFRSGKKVLRCYIVFTKVF